MINYFLGTQGLWYLGASSHLIIDNHIKTNIGEDMEKITEIFVLLDDKPGSIYELTRILKKKRINILAIGLFIDTARLFVDSAENALKYLQDQGYPAESREVLSIMMPNKSGALMEITKKLCNAGINITYLYGTMEKEQKRGRVVLEVDKMDLALDIFKNHKF